MMKVVIAAEVSGDEVQHFGGEEGREERKEEEKDGTRDRWKMYTSRN